MIIALYQRQDTQGMILQYVAATPFGYQRALKDPLQGKLNSQ
jgi:hypothetical protein